MSQFSLDEVGPAAREQELDRLRRENAELRQEKEYFVSIVRNFRNGLLTVDNDLKIVFFNLVVERLLGYDPQELYGMKLHRLIQAREETVLNILHQGGLCVDPKTGEMGSFSFITKSGNVFPVEACFSVITDIENRVCGMTCTFRDVTQKKRMEKAMARMDRLASLGELASGMAHEIKNPLACIAGVLQNLQLGEQGSAGAGMVPEILSQVEKIDSIINGLLHFAKPGPVTMAPLQVCEVLDATIFLVDRYLQEKSIELELDYGEDNPWVRGDKQLLQQAFLNILMNACEALSEVERQRLLRVAVRRQKPLLPDEPEADGSAYEMVEIEIRDNGVGIDKNSLDAVFNPFFTTKYRGTGLGLATSHRIMEQHDGTITVDSSPGEGSVFKLTLPAYHESEK
ncbi:MAG: PAS domain S-box protein [Deltaproteobacteria bacterium]|nr:PAS domain S-box protein [Deltaproteobacteria bacterium]